MKLSFARAKETIPVESAYPKAELRRPGFQRQTIAHCINNPNSDRRD